MKKVAQIGNYSVQKLDNGRFKVWSWVTGDIADTYSEESAWEIAKKLAIGETGEKAFVVEGKVSASVYCRIWADSLEDAKQKVEDGATEYREWKDKEWETKPVVVNIKPVDGASERPNIFFAAVELNSMQIASGKADLRKSSAFGINTWVFDIDEFDFCGAMIDMDAPRFGEFRHQGTVAYTVSDSMDGARAALQDYISKQYKIAKDSFEMWENLSKQVS